MTTDTINPAAIAKLLGDILGRQVTVVGTPAFTISARDPRVVAIYQAGDHTIVCICDLGFVANAGAALSLLPAQVAKDSIKAGKMDSAEIENFQEILNICMQLFSGPEKRRVKLESVCNGSAALPRTAQSIVAAPRWRLDVQLTIAGYGGGRMSILR